MIWNAKTEVFIQRIPVNAKCYNQISEIKWRELGQGLEAAPASGSGIIILL